MAGPDAPRTDGFEPLRRRFAAGLPARWAEIAAAPDPGSQAAALHRLAGAAGGYGFPALDSAARRALGLVEARAGAAATPAALATLREALEAAAAEFAPASQSDDSCGTPLRSNPAPRVP